MRKVVFYFILFISIFVGLNKSSLLQLVNIFILPISGNIKELSAYMEINTRYGWVIFWLEQICIYFLVVYANKIIVNDYNNSYIKNYNCVEYEKVKFSNLLVKINYYMFLFLPLFILNENYTRIIRNLLPLNYIVFVIALTRNGNKIIFDKKRLMLLLCIFLYIMVLFFLLYKSYSLNIIYPTFNENWII